MLGKKKIKDVEMRKPATISRLIKCYVCNQHFQSQGHFDVHLKQHQNKFSKTNLEEIQRKTQESFRSKKSIPVLNRTQIIDLPSQEKNTIESIKENLFARKEQSPEESQQRQIEEALRESQILLQKIEFITQIGSQEEGEVAKVVVEDEVEDIEKTIDNERRLFELIRGAAGEAGIQKLILQTNFENKYFENYQEQLLHLRLLAGAAINPASISKIVDIRRNICRDIYVQLQHLYGKADIKVTQNAKRSRPNPVRRQNQGNLHICIDCCSPISSMDQFYQLDCGHCYHLSCWGGECCG